MDQNGGRGGSNAGSSGGESGAGQWPRRRQWHRRRTWQAGGGAAASAVAVGRPLTSPACGWRHRFSYQWTSAREHNRIRSAPMNGSMGMKRKRALFLSWGASRAIAWALPLLAIAAGCFKTPRTTAPDADVGGNGGGSGAGGMVGAGGGGPGGVSATGGAGGVSLGGSAGGAPKKPDGEPCSAAGECASGICGGRCCAAGCTCTLPSPTNLLRNAGIDVDLNNWTTDIGTIARTAYDAERCAYSGSLAATVDAEQEISQCVQNVPLAGDFNFGVRTRGPQGAICQVNFYSGFNCDADIVLSNETDTSTPTSIPDWTLVSGTIRGVIGANSVVFRCYLLPAAGATYYLDMFYVSKSPGTF